MFVVSGALSHHYSIPLLTVSYFIDEVALYNVMRETLVYLTNLGGEQTQEVMMKLLKTFTDDAKNPNQRNWNPTVLSRLCWAIGVFYYSVSTLHHFRFD